ncbi:hypothetical protein V6N11_019355 [Hibiscus sabdariffa]|uniref:RNase H type-1 domain-containing protein n=1 Tax=Hibiscus sabdariffa TaxID=183260 RepID=A0ABR2R2Y2_9ROSI
MKSLINITSPHTVNWKKVVWLGLAPPKVEAFGWLILHERVPVKVELLKRGIISLPDDRCPFCNKERETVEHLFFTCFVSWKIWNSIANYWGLSLVLHRNPLKFVLGWPHHCSKLASDSMWQLLPFAIIWSLWLHRNEIIFQSKSLDAIRLFHSVKMRASWWWKALQSDSKIPLDSISSDPSIASIKGAAPSSSSAKGCWTPPPVGFLKFNVDGACNKEGICGVGGVLRDENGVVLMKVSHRIGYGSALLAEILAIKSAIDHFVNSIWAASSRLIIESDSKIVVEWISSPSLSSPLFRNLIQGTGVGDVFTRFGEAMSRSGAIVELLQF